MSLFNLHYLLGLVELGYEVHYLERQAGSLALYDPDADAMTDDPAYALRYLARVMGEFGVGAERVSFVDLAGRCHGSGWTRLRAALGRAELLLALCEPVWLDELERVPRRLFLDGDPLFTQAAMVAGEGVAALERYDTLFTFAARLGEPGCTVPAAGRRWRPTRPPVATSRWDPRPAPGPSPVTALLHWSSGREVTLGGRTYGHKDRELEGLIDLPRRCARPFVLAVGGAAPRERLVAHGWRLVDPLAATRTIESYLSFIAASGVDLGIAKHAYVASRSGWFSDRAACFLAAGRPVLHQDTGFGDWLGAKEGVLAFRDAEEAIEGLARLERDYGRHARAARAVAEEHFEAGRVVADLLAAAEL